MCSCHIPGGCPPRNPLCPCCPTAPDPCLEGSGRCRPRVSVSGLGVVAVPTLSLHLQLLWSPRAAPNPLRTPAGSLGLCASLTLPHCVGNGAGASPELLNKSSLSEGVTSPTCSAQDLHLEHQRAPSSQENSLPLFLFGFLMAFLQVHSLKTDFFFFSSQSTELVKISAGARAIHSNLKFDF